MGTTFAVTCYSKERPTLRVCTTKVLTWPRLAPRGPNRHTVRSTGHNAPAFSRRLRTTCARFNIYRSCQLRCRVGTRLPQPALGRDHRSLAWRLCNARAPCGATVEPRHQPAQGVVQHHTPAHLRACISICALAEHTAAECPAAGAISGQRCSDVAADAEESGSQQPRR